MGKGKGKAKKHSAIASHEDLGNGAEEKIAGYRRRGRPQKPAKNNLKGNEEEDEKLEDSENTRVSIPLKDMKSQTGAENGKKRKRDAHAKKSDLEKNESGIELNSSSNDSTKAVGFRQNGSRRKNNKPCRAAR